MLTGSNASQQRANKVQSAAYNPRKHSPEVLFDMFSQARIVLEEGAPEQFFVNIVRVDEYTVARISVASFGNRAHLAWHPSAGRGAHRCILIFVAKGALEVTATEKRINFSEEGIGIGFPSREPLHLKTRSSLEAISLTFDAAEVSPTEISPDAVNSLRADSVVVTASYALLRALMTSPKLSENIENPRSLKSMLNGLARGIVFEAQNQADDLYTRAEALIEDGHANPAMDPSTIAGQLNVSLSTLRRHFAKHGHGVAERIRFHRAATVRQLRKAHPDMPVKELQKLAGFSSEASLRRALSNGVKPER